MDEVDHLFLNNYVTPQIKESKLEIEPYFDSIVLACKKTIESVWIEYFKIDHHQLCEIIKASSHLKMLRFEWCHIDFSEILNQ